MRAFTLPVKYVKCRALSRFAFHSYIAAALPHNAMHHGQSQPVAALALGAEKGSNICRIVAASMPMPLSRTSISA